MDKEQIQQLSVEEAAKIAHEMDLKELQQFAVHFTLEQLQGIFPMINENNNAEWSKKTLLLLSHVLNIRWLEGVGKVLTPMQFRELLDHSLQDKSQHWKLSPLVAGMSHENFEILLNLASYDQLNLLKHEGIAEPLQFQLRTLAHDWLYTIERYCAEAGALEQEILSLNLSTLDPEAYQSLLNKIENLEENLENLLGSINRALALSWHTNRIDLIEKLSLDKELSQKTIAVVIGNPRTETSSPSGLYQFLEKRLSENFGNASSPDALKDEDSPFEALGKFSLWHLEDYWDYGLLPKIGSKDQLHLDPEQYSPEVCEKHQIKLLQEVQKNLEALGLKRVKDFKLKGIWSARIFKEFIKDSS